MVVVSHPTGNAFARALAETLHREGLLQRFYTTLAVPGQLAAWRFLPAAVREELLRRSFSLPGHLIRQTCLREALRIGGGKLGWTGLTRHERGWASVDSVYGGLDRRVARALVAERPAWVYCYEDAARESFRAAARLGIGRAYDLPIAYWKVMHRILDEEAERLPAWEPTLVATRDSEEKLARKDEELDLAEVVVCPSEFVLNSLPAEVRDSKCCVLAPFGSPTVEEEIGAVRSDRGGEKLRILFAGSMTQRKGLADVFAAMRLLHRSDVELVVMGTPIVPMSFYRSQYADFRYEPTRSHAEVLRLMKTCDALVLPSLVEGRALVQQEAMMCGLPIIVTSHAGGEDLIDQGETGFLVPIRSPEAIAEKIEWLAGRRKELPRMRAAARKKAMEYRWTDYGQTILAALAPEMVQASART